MPQTIQALTILVLVLTPGYITYAVARRSNAPREDSDLRFIFRMVAYGAISHAIVFPLTIRLLARFDNATSDGQSIPAAINSELWLTLIYVTLLIFVVPAIVGVAISWLSNRQNSRIEHLLELTGLSHHSYVSRTASAWQYVMDKQEPFYVRVFMTDGGVVGGVFGADSLASVDSDHSDLYLESTWVLDGSNEFFCQVPTSRGLWIPRETVRYVEFLDGLDEGEPFADEQTRATISTEADQVSATDTAKAG